MRRLHFDRAVVVLAMLALLTVAGCGREGGGQRRGAAPTPVVEAVQARHGALPLTQRLSGVVRGRNQVRINPEISAVVTDVLARDGDTVAAGQALVRLRDQEFRDRLKQATASHQIAQAQAKQADARLAEARSALRRVEGLAAEQLVSDADLEASQTRAISAEADAELAHARVDQAAASMAEQQGNLARTVIRAPVEGSVGDRNAEVGMRVDPSTQLFTLGRLDSVYVQVVLTDEMLNFIAEGQSAEIALAGRGLPLAGTLDRISPFLHPVTHSTQGEIDVANPDGKLKPGMFVTVDVFYGQSADATLVPLSALYEQPSTGVSGVYVCDADLGQQELQAAGDDPGMALSGPVDFRFVPVQVIASGRMEAGVSGVETGDWVVTLGQNLLGPERSQAKARPVGWDWVEKLQSLQREDLLQDMIERKPSS
ncbi:efflux RND transporter periplasmic adaptor subunit [bacterium]|nr:efflux RND transporter periplasmic adaptor subunit [bacterium]